MKKQIIISTSDSSHHTVVQKNKMTKNNSAFTLAELLVTMTVLAILSTIAYMYIEGNISDSRDAKRKTDLNQLETSLLTYFVKESEFPIPDEPTDITMSGSYVAWTQGTLGPEVIKKLKTFGQDVPVDPSYGNAYTYSISNKAQEFQLASLLQNFEEEEELGELAFDAFMPSAHADTVDTAHVVGNYNGFMVRVVDDINNIDYFFATPSIITYDISDTDVVSTIINRKLVFHEFFNIPHSYEGYVAKLDGGFNFNVIDPLIFSGSINELKQESELLDFNSKLKYIYSTTPTESFDKYLTILEDDGFTSLKKYLTKTFKIRFRSYFNCKDILDDFASEGDGEYTISPNADGVGSYTVYCDMTTDGGGWTRVGDNHITNGNFSGGVGVTDAIENELDTNEIVSLTTPVDGNDYALHQSGNYSSNYQMTFDDPTLLKPGYEIRMSMWRSDYGSGAVDVGIDDTKLLGGKSNPWTIGTCVTGGTGAGCQFQGFNKKLANPANFGPGGALTEIEFSVVDPVNTITTSYLDGGILFDGYTPSSGTNAYGTSTYSESEKQAIDAWVLAGGFLIATNDEQDYDPLGEFYGVKTEEYDNNGNVVLNGVSGLEEWVVENIDHPIVNGEIGLGVDLRGRLLTGPYRRSGLKLDAGPEDIILARERRTPFTPTVILRKHGKGHILITSGDGIFKDMDNTTTFDTQDFETVLAANIMTYAIETAAGINPHEGYVFHNRVYYNDGTFSTNGKDEILETITVDGKIWTKEQTRHKIYKTPENFNWYLGLDANNNKDLYFTGLRLELFYR